MKTNVKIQKEKAYTHEGGLAEHLTPEKELRRSLMACLLGEDTFYESGIEISERITNLVPKINATKVSDLAIEAREDMKLRHAPLWVVRAMASNEEHKARVAYTLSKIIQRPDELGEFLSLYWKDGKVPISAQVKKGLARAFAKFDAYQLAKYNRDSDEIKLRDVMFLVHPKPKDKTQAEIWKQLVDNNLPVPFTWETAISAAKTDEDKKQAWCNLLRENKLGALALLRNLRNIQKANVPEAYILEAIKRMKTDRVLPYRFIAAAKYVPQWEPQLEEAMFKCLDSQEKLPRKTILLIDVSGSMYSPLSDKSDLRRVDAACGLAILARELCEDVRTYSFSNNCILVPSRRGFALRDAIENSQCHGSTYLGRAIDHIVNKENDFDRFIIITDEQTADQVNFPTCKGYLINVASYQYGIGYRKWTHLDGFSEAVLDYILKVEKE